MRFVAHVLGLIRKVLICRISFPTKSTKACATEHYSIHNVRLCVYDIICDSYTQVMVLQSTVLLLYKRKEPELVRPAARASVFTNAVF